MPLFPKYIEAMKREYSNLNPNKSKCFSFTSTKEDKKGFFSKTAFNKKLIYEPNSEQFNSANKVLELIRDSLKIYITNLIPPFEESFLIEVKNLIFVNSNTLKNGDQQQPQLPNYNNPNN